MPEPRALNIAIFLADVTAANGPLLLLPRSHHHNEQVPAEYIDREIEVSSPVFVAEHDTWSSSYPLWTVQRPLVQALAARGGVTAATGKVRLLNLVLLMADCACTPVNHAPCSLIVAMADACHLLPSPSRVLLSRCADAFRCYAAGRDRFVVPLLPRARLTPKHLSATQADRLSLPL